MILYLHVVSFNCMSPDVCISTLPPLDLFTKTATIITIPTARIVTMIATAEAPIVIVNSCISLLALLLEIIELLPLGPMDEECNIEGDSVEVYIEGDRSVEVEGN